MKASEVISELNRLVAQHGDLETLYECKDDLLEIDGVGMDNVVYLKPKDNSGSKPTSVFLIS
ncbi:MAG: hypothetical protein JWQ21_3992 [Herminiimonas sp.]|nr:hypothetical protein [Herminiimonas sp.]